MDWYEMLGLLLFGHALADFPLQGDFLARAKSHAQPIPGVPWIGALMAHASIHGGFVGVLTGSFALGLCEAAAHVGIDHLKCGDRISFALDQWLHVACKVAWVACLVAREGFSR